MLFDSLPIICFNHLKNDHFKNDPPKKPSPIFYLNVPQRNPFPGKTPLSEAIKNVASVYIYSCYLIR